MMDERLRPPGLPHIIRRRTPYEATIEAGGAVLAVTDVGIGTPHGLEVLRGPAAIRGEDDLARAIERAVGERERREPTGTQWCEEPAPPGRDRQSVDDGPPPRLLPLGILGLAASIIGRSSGGILGEGVADLGCVTTAFGAFFFSGLPIEWRYPGEKRGRLGDRCHGCRRWRGGGMGDEGPGYGCIGERIVPGIASSWPDR